MSAKALRYAEENLGVHVVWENVQTYLQDLDELLAELDKAHDRKRQLNEDYADREVELVHEMRTAHVSMTDTRFKSEWKGWERTDKSLGTIRVELNKVLSEIQGLEYDTDLLKLRIRSSSARLEELGGYLHYLAAVKTAARKQTQAETVDEIPEREET